MVVLYSYDAAVAAALSFLTLLLYKLFGSKTASNPKRLPYPPGPKARPLIGNVLDVTGVPSWLDYAAWCKKFGDVVHVTFFGTHIVLLDSTEACEDLLEKRSAIYSDRPPLTMLRELNGWEWAFAFTNYGARWRKERKMFNDHFKFESSKQYQPEHEIETRRFLRRLLDSPKDFRHHIQHLAAATVMRVTYGFDVKDSTNKYLQIAERAMEGIAEGAVPGKWLVDQLPILKYVPSWLPGAGFKRKAAYWNSANRTLRDVPFEDVKKALNSDHPPPASVASRLLESLADSSDPAQDEVHARAVAAVAYAGGSDTSTSSLAAFFAAMVQYPEVQKRAQAELDTVVGRDRLPDFNDRPSLPYLNAVVKEVLRWEPVAPMAIARRLTQDDEYRGYFLPKGSLIIPNAWSILHNEKTYPEPSVFKPERFLDASGKLDPAAVEPEIAAFGFGRRVCPGRYVADNTMYLAFASVLSCFNIEHEVDANGKPIPVQCKMTPTNISYPEEFKCRIVPRSPQAAALISSH